MRSALRVVAVIFAVPVGAVIGFYGAAFLCAGILKLQGMDKSPGDFTLAVISTGAMGAVVSATFFPWCVWRFVQPVRAPESGKVSKPGLGSLLMLGCVGNFIGIVGVISSPKANWYAVPVIVLSTAMLVIGIHQWARAGKDGK